MSKLHHILLALGTNTNRHENLLQAKDLLKVLLERPVWSKTVETKALGDGTGLYLNCVVVAQTRYALRSVVKSIKHIERSCGDSRQKRRMGTVNMDIDILLFDEQRMHEADWQRPYIKTLLQEIDWNE